MPLILLCGYPCSGKSLVASRLANSLQVKLTQDQSAEVPVMVIAEPVMDVSAGDGRDPRCSVYGDSVRERELRALHKSEVERALTSGDRPSSTPGAATHQPPVVIMDAGNHIKGSRYELYCLAKSVKQAHAVVFCDTPVDLVHKWNDKIGRYPTQLLTAMIDCFEAPQPIQRWDQPLLVFRADELGSQFEMEIDIDPLASDLYDRLLADGQKRLVKPNRSTELATVTPTHVLQELERITQTTCEHIMTKQAMGQAYADVPPSLLLGGKAGYRQDVSTARLILQGRQRPFTLGELARSKRRFIGVQRAHLKENIEPVSIAAAFLRFIATSQ